MRMLLIEWQAWWADIPALQAEEHLSQYTIQVLGDSGWTMDREGILSAWRAMAQGLYVRVANWISPNESPGVTEADFEPGALRRNAHRVWGWLRSNFGGGIG